MHTKLIGAASALLVATAGVGAGVATTAGPASARTTSGDHGSVVYRWGALGAPIPKQDRHTMPAASVARGGTPSPRVAPGVVGRVIQIATSNSDSYALTASGAVYAWGQGRFGELGAGRGDAPAVTYRAVRVQFPAGVKITALSNPSPYDTGMAIDSTGHAWGWGIDAGDELCQPMSGPVFRPVEVPLSNVSLAVGALNHAIYDTDGHIVSCGAGPDGQLGNGTSGTSGRSDTPVAVQGLPTGRVVDLTSSWGDAGVEMANGSYYDWGFNQGGQVGNGTTAMQTTAVEVSLPSPVKQVSQGGSTAGNGQTMAILRNGTLWEWGNGSDGQMGDGQTINRTTPFQMTEPRGVHFVFVNSGGATNYALDRAGQLFAWGRNSTGQIGDGTKSIAQLTPKRDAVTLSQVSSTAGEVMGLGVPGSAR